VGLSADTDVLEDIGPLPLPSALFLFTASKGPVE
jgi:hypothetical protein